MRSKFFILTIIAVSLAFSSIALASAKIEFKKISLVAPTPFSTSIKKITLKVVQLLPSKWTVPVIIDELNKVNSIFTQCGIEIGTIKFYRIKFNSSISDELDAENWPGFWRYLRFGKKMKLHWFLQKA